MQSSHHPEIDQLIQALAKLPGLGPRSARRAVLHLIKRKEGEMIPLSTAMKQVADDIDICSECGNLDTANPCAVCADLKRDRSVICVVEQVSDLWALDRAQSYKGQYHVLGGVLSALDGIRPEDLTIDKLIERAAASNVKEVILATNATVEGQITAHYISEKLQKFDVKVTAIAHGVPVGGELDYMDDGTLIAALKARKPVI